MNRLVLPLALILAAVASPALGEWRVQDSQDEISSASTLRHRHLDLVESETRDEATLDLALFSTKTCALRVIDNGENRGELAEIMRRTSFLAGVNGGYFDPEFRPLGLRIVDKKTISPLGHGRLMSGIVCSNGAVQVLRLTEFPHAKKFEAAIECGPMIIDQSNRVHGLEETRTARRTFVAIDGRGRGALGSSSAVTLAGLSDILATRLGDFKIQRALNLDGGSSSAFWFKREDGSAFSIAEDKTVRDFVAVVPR